MIETLSELTRALLFVVFSLATYAVIVVGKSLIGIPIGTEDPVDEVE